MSHLSVEVINKPCAFVLEIENPVETLKKLAMQNLLSIARSKKSGFIELYSCWSNCRG